MAISESGGRTLEFSDLLSDLSLIYENESSHYFEALNVYKNTKGIETSENLNELTKSLVLLEFYVSELLSTMAVHNPQQEVYYYTSISHLQKVLSDDKEQVNYRLPIFCISHMNDPREGKELENTLFQKLGKKSLLQALFHQQQNTPPTRKKLDTEFVFVKSFTNNADALPMWIHYGNTGSGCCVKVARSFFTNFSSDLSGEEKKLTTNPFDHEYRLYTVLYVKDGRLVNSVSSEIKALFENVFSLFLSVSNIYQKVSSPTQELVLQSISKITRKLKYLIKSSDYSYEQEMRIVLWRPLSDLKRDDIDLRLTPSSEKNPIPKVYVYTTKSLPIEEIIFGPKVVETDNLVPFFTKELLSLHNYDARKVLITKSEIEYR